MSPSDGGSRAGGGSAAGPGLEVDVRATFRAAGAAPFVVDVDLAVPAGETTVVLGPSGSGKTLLLETVAGYHPHEGTVRRGGVDVTDRPPEDRGFGFVVQEYALFPHMTARENVAFGRRYHDGGRDPDALLSDLGVADLAERYPETLSGGERQRVALARSLAVDPAVVLLDEPLSALDPPTRRALRADVADALADVTALVVTHDRTTARALGDRVAVVADGRVRQSGPVGAVFDAPASAFVARFTGANVLAAGAGRGSDDGGDGDQFAVRPEHVVLAAGDGDPTGGADAGGAPADGDRLLRGRVERVVREDAAHRVTLSTPAGTLDALVADPPAVGAAVVARLPADRVTPLP